MLGYVFAWTFCTDEEVLSSSHGRKLRQLHIVILYTAFLWIMLMMIWQLPLAFGLRSRDDVTMNRICLRQRDKS